MSDLKMNESFNIMNYDYLGFDLDNTIIKYNIKNIVDLGYIQLTKYLVTYKEYPVNTFDNSIENHLDFFQKGLLIDLEKGNVLKISRGGYIHKATHGTKPITETELSSIYTDRKWDPVEEFCKDTILSSFNVAPVFRMVTDCLEMPALLIFAQIVDYIDSNKPGVKEYTQIWPDLSSGFLNVYSKEDTDNLLNNYFNELKIHPEKYIYKTSDIVINWLKELKKEERKKCVVLITGSWHSLAQITAPIALGPDWKDLFHIIILRSKKPGFFTKTRPFYKIDNGTDSNIIASQDELDSGNIFSSGNWNDLVKSLDKRYDITTHKFLYVGDNLIQDIYTPREFSNSDTITICEEMVTEAYFPVELNTNRTDFWGSFFTIDNTCTMQMDLIRKYSNISVPSLDVIAEKPMDYQYKSYSDSNPDDGFYK